MSTTTTALISGGVSLLVAGVTTAGAYLLQRTRLRDDLRQQDRRLQAELERQREKAADDSASRNTASSRSCVRSSWPRPRSASC